MPEPARFQSLNHWRLSGTEEICLVAFAVRCVELHRVCSNAQWCVGLLPAPSNEIEIESVPSPPFFLFGKKERGKSEIYAPSTRRFRVALGRVIVVPSKSFVTLTWQPSRDLQKAFRACGSVSLPSQTGGQPRAVGLTCRSSRTPGRACPVFVLYIPLSLVSFIPSHSSLVMDTYILVIVWLLELVVHVLLQNHMASRTGDRLLTSGYVQGVRSSASFIGTIAQYKSSNAHLRCPSRTPTRRRQCRLPRWPRR